MSRENRGGAGHRQQRVEKEMREVIGMYLLGGFRGELPGMVSVSKIILSGDLRNAKVLVSLLVPGAAEAGTSTEAQRKATIEELQDHAYEIQDEVNRKLRMKFCPKLTFAYDEGLDKALHVENVLRTLRPSTEKDPKDSE